MLGQLKSKLKASANFPSPPAIAQQIIALAWDPRTDIAQVATAIGRDPALAARLLRVAASILTGAIWPIRLCGPSQWTACR